MSWVYVIGTLFGSRVKVGMTEDIDTRLQNLQRASPFPLKIYHRRKTHGRQMAMLLEYVSHQILMPHRSHGEWFRCEPEAAIYAVDLAAITISETLWVYGNELRHADRSFWLKIAQRVM